MNNRDIILQAMKRAYQEHNRLGINQTKPVDIFGVLYTLDIELYFDRLLGLSGAYIPARNRRPGVGRAGVLINAGHPYSRQRYTAAHEYAHHLTDEELTIDLGILDGTRHLKSRDEYASTVSEVRADAFASFFLMPSPLVRAMSLRTGLDPTLLSKMLTAQLAPSIYQMALRMGTSYQATVVQMQNLKALTYPQSRSLEGIEPGKLKQQLVRDRYPVASWRSDVWAVSKQEHGEVIKPMLEDIIHITLPQEQLIDGWQEAGCGSVDLIFEDKGVTGKAGSHWSTFAFRRTSAHPGAIELNLGGESFRLTLAGVERRQGRYEPDDFSRGILDDIDEEEGEDDTSN